MLIYRGQGMHHLSWSQSRAEEVELSLHHQYFHTVDGKRGIRTGDRLGLEKTVL